MKPYVRFAVICMFLNASTLHARQSILPAAMKPPAGTFVNGYDTATGGATILYHSVNPHAREARIARGSGADQYAQWRTAPAPVHAKGNVVFAWLAGVSASKGEHAFSVAVNGTVLARFVTPSDTNHKTILAEGTAGAKLVFRATEVDRYGDMFGFMFLSLPGTYAPPGKPLSIRVTGANDGSDSWVMIFQHRLVDRSWITPYPALLRGNRGPVQPLLVEIERYGQPVDCRVALSGGEQKTGRLQWGLTPFTMHSPPVKTATTRKLSVRAGALVLADTLVSLRPVNERTFYLLPHSHTDIGYSAYQAVVEQNHMRYLDSAIEIARRTASYPEGARFRWNIEVLWPLESYCRAASAGKLERLAAAIDSGWIGLNGLYANVLTGLCRPEEFYHLTDFARISAARFSHRVNAAMITDIPAYSSAVVTGLARAGIRYFSSGPNYVPFLPDGGDRIGFALKAWGDRPFYWVSASGQDTVLFWMAGHGYSWFHPLNIGELSKAIPSDIFAYLGELDAQGYPYDMIQVRYTIGGDNGPPDPNLSDFIRKWNGEYISPRFAIATTEELFERFEKKYGASLPRITGDLTPYWEDGAASTARELAWNRRVAEDVTQTETLYALLGLRRFSPDSAYAIWRNVILFDEHTWGASNSISDPGNPDVKAQWDYKRGYLDAAMAEEQHFREGILPPAPAGAVRAIDIINTSSWARTDLVILPKSVRTAGIRAHNGSGAPVPSQRLSSGELALLVTNVPPFGCERIMFEEGPPFPPQIPAAAAGTGAGNGSIGVTVNPRTGNISTLETLGRNYADTAGGGGLNQYLYVPGRDPSHALPDSGIAVSVAERGPLVATLRVVSHPPGGTLLSRTVRVTAGLNRVDIADSLWKGPSREKESVHIAFPFNVPGGETRIDNTFSILRPDSDQIAGACRDYFAADRWVDVSNAEGGVLTALPDAPLLETGTMTDERQNAQGTRSWRERAEAGSRIYSYVMNNYWHTNYKADQEGLAVFRYSLLPHGPFDGAAAVRFGAEIAQPLVPVMSPTFLTPGSSLLTVDPASVVATALTPAAHGGWILHLYNAGSEPARTTVNWNGPPPNAISRRGLQEGPATPCTFPALIPPSGTAFFLIR